MKYTRQLVIGAVSLLAGAAIYFPVSAATVPAPVAGTTVAKWTFNQSSGTTVNDTGATKKHPAVLSPTMSDFGFVQDTPHVYVGNFRNEDALLTIAPSSDLSPGANDFSTEVVVKTTDTRTNMFQAGTLQAGKDFIKMESSFGKGDHSNLTGVPRCRYIGSLTRGVSEGGTPGVALFGDRTIADGGWHTIHCDKYANKIVMRIDGDVAATRNIAIGSVDVSTRTWSLGGKYMPNNDGLVDPHDMFTGQMKNVSLVIKR